MKTSSTAAMLLFALMAFTVLIGETKAARIKRIIGGTTTPSNKFNYVVSIINMFGYAEHLCNGAIISPRHIITSASCLELIHQVVVRSGKHDVLPSVVGKDTVEKCRFVHSTYKRSRSPIKNGYDVAIVQLREDLVINNVTTTIVSLADSEPNMMEPFTVVGFGDTTFDRTLNLKERVLRYATVTLLNNAACQAKGGDLKSHEKLCAIGRDNTIVDLCKGDRGAPLVSSDNKLRGIGAYSSKGHNTPHFYTSLFPIRQWITDTMKQSLTQTCPIDYSQKSARPGPSKALG